MAKNNGKPKVKAGIPAGPAAGLTGVELELYNHLSDGLAHTKEELQYLIDGSYCKPGTLACHLSMMRNVLVPRGIDIRNERLRHGSYYRLVILANIIEE